MSDSPAHTKRTGVEETLKKQAQLQAYLKGDGNP